MAERMFNFVPIQVEVAELLKTFHEFPLRQEPTSFNLERVIQTLPYRPDTQQSGN
jgi:arylsulfatase